MLVCKLLAALAWLCLRQAAASAQAASTCETEPAEAKRLMQMGSERVQHPGTGKGIPLEPIVKDGVPEKEDEASGSLLFVLSALGRAFPIPVSELPQLPLGVMSGPESGGGGTLVFFTLLILVLICSLAIITFLNDEDEDPRAVKRLQQLQGRSIVSSTTTAGGSHTVSGPGTWQKSQESLPATREAPVEVQRPPGDVAPHVPLTGPQASRPWASSYLPQVPTASMAREGNAQHDTQKAAPPWSSSYLEAAEPDTVPNLPPMLSAFPPVWGGGPSPVAEDVEPSEVSRPSTLRLQHEEDTVPFAPTTSNLTEPALPEVADIAGDLDTSGTLCPAMIVDPTSECAMAVPIAHQDLQALSMTIMSLDQRPVLRAEVYRGEECQAPGYFSPLIGEFWPPEDVRLISSDRGNQHPSVVLTSLPPELRLQHDAEEVVEDAEILSTGYLVKADEQSLEFDIYNGRGEFFGRMGRDHSRSCRFVMRGGNFGEVRYFVDGVFEDYAVLFTDICQDTLADGEAFDLASLPFPEAAGCMRLRIHGTQEVDAGLILTMLFCAYELRNRGA